MATSASGSSLTVVGNLAVDRVDGRSPSPGGCPSFAAQVFSHMGLGGRIVTKCAPSDASIFGGALSAEDVTVTVLDAATTNAFELVYAGEERTMTVAAVGTPWTASELRGAQIDTHWVHAAPLLRNEFPAASLSALRAAGHAVSMDGQGLVRVPRRGALVTDADYDPAVLEQLTVLKLADDEATVIAGGTFSEAHARRLGVPEIIVTCGSAGADLYLDGMAVRVSPTRRIAGVHTTGSGDMFAIGYAAARARGVEPSGAAQAACELVADVLERRRAGEPV